MRQTRVMKPEEDAFGQMIWSCYRGKEVFEVWERDDGHISVDEPETYFLEYEDWALHHRKTMEFVKGRVLDIGCVAGRHSLYLQEKGFDVLGIDVSPLAIKVCTLRGLKKAKVMSIEEMCFKPSSFESEYQKHNRWNLKTFQGICEDSGFITEIMGPFENYWLYYIGKK